MKFCRMTSSLWSGGPSPKAFLICLLGSTTFVCVSQTLVKSPQGKKKHASEDESARGAEMIRPPTNDSTPSPGALLDFKRTYSFVLSKVSQQEC